MDTIKAANKVIKEGIALLSDDMKGDFKAQASDIFIDEAINNACGALNENEEKIAMLRAYAVQEANRVASTLWREGLITPEYEKEYRALPSMKEMADAYNVFTDERKGRMDEVMADHKVIADEERELDIFKGIINGIPAEESEKRYDEYRQQQQAAMGR
jgi:hypothetical protein